MRLIVVAVILFLAAGNLAAASPEADRIAAEIKSEGAGPVVRNLWNSGQYDHVLQAIASGDVTFIALSPQLAAGADAGAAEALGVALARALPQNAGVVLSVLDPQRSAIAPARVCGIPFVEGTITDVESYRRAAEAAVERVDQPALRKAKAACKAALRAP